MPIRFGAIVFMAVGLLVGCSNDEEPSEKDAVEAVQQDVEKEKAEEVNKEQDNKTDEYLNTLQETLNDFSYNMNLIHNQYAKVEEDSILLIDADWRVETMGYFDAIALEKTSLMQAEVPEGYQEIHDKTLEALDYNKEARDIFFDDLFTAKDIQVLEDGAMSLRKSLDAIEAVDGMLLEKITEKNEKDEI